MSSSLDCSPPVIKCDTCKRDIFVGEIHICLQNLLENMNEQEKRLIKAVMNE